MMKKIFSLILSFAVLMVVTVCLSSCTDDGTRVSFTAQSYSTDPQPITDRFPSLGQPEQVYWKQHTFGSGLAACIGPTSYRLTGFAITDAVESLSNKKFTDAGVIDYPDGIGPDITGFTQFDWRKYPDFTAELLGNHYIGTVLVDVQKRLVYFDVENL